MINRIVIMIACAVAIALGTASLSRAQSLQDVIVTRLIEEGYDEIETKRTFLGRIRITAENSELYREIVINPNTGVILRDYIRRKVLVGGQLEFHNPYDDDDDDDDEDDDSEDGDDDEEDDDSEEDDDDGEED